MVIRKFKLYCLVIRFSHFSIENITIIEIRQTTTNIPQVSARSGSSGKERPR